MLKSEITRSHWSSASSRRIPCSVSTRLSVGANPPLRRAWSTSSSLSAESSTNNTRKGVAAGSLTPAEARSRSANTR